MYRAVYTFVTEEAQALSFSVDDRFTVMETNDNHWWLVQNGYGQVGYVPANYLQEEEKVAMEEVLQSVDRAIEVIHFQATCSGGGYTTQQRSNLQKLLQHRKNLTKDYSPQNPQQKRHSKGRAPAVPQVDQARSNDDSKGNQLLKREPLRSSGSKRAAPKPPVRGDSELKSSRSRSSQAVTSHMPSDQLPESSPRWSSSSSDSPDGAPQLGSTLGYGQSAVASQTSFTLVSAERPTQLSPMPGYAVASQTSLEPELPHSDVTDQATSPVKILSATPAHLCGHVTTPSSSSPKHTKLHDIPADIGSKLIEQIRRNTGLSHDKSRIAVGTVLGCMKENIPSIANILDDVLKNLFVASDALLIESSQDASRLQIIFSELSACKDDSQQRSWALHEDEAVITEYLQELISILNNADVEVSRQVIIRDNYDAVHTLVLYYQMETRKSIRLLLLQSFGVLCGVNAVIISELLTSVLPLEMARDMQSQVTETEKLSYSALVLTMIFSMGESMPVQHYEHLSEDFVCFLLEHIETNEPEHISDLFVNLILAFNLQFCTLEENVVMRVLAKWGTAKTLTEKLMLLVNRGEDPVRMFEHEPKPVDSLLKFFSDIYSCRSTADLLYTNDAKVLIDIIIRQLTDLSAVDKLRVEYLSLIHLILLNSNYGDHKHRCEELENCFTAIQNEDTQDNDMDKCIILQIWKDFPHYFGSGA